MKEIIEKIVNDAKTAQKDLLSLDDILKKCPHPRATFFRCLKKLRDNKFVRVIKDTEDARRSFIKVYPKFIN